MFCGNYEYFLRIVEQKSISKAAESLFISQPSLSKYLQRLENYVGAELFDRKQTPLRLTLAGQLFYDYLIRSIEEERKLQIQIDEVKNADRARITIGMPLWRASTLLPAFLPLFSQKHPLVHIDLVEGSAAILENAIAKNEIDFGLMNLPVNYANVSYVPILEEHIFLVGSRQNAFLQAYLPSVRDGGSHPHVDIRDFTGQPFILTQPGQHITTFVNSALSRNSLELNCVFRTSNVSTAVNLAAANMGFTFVPEFGTQGRQFPRESVRLFTFNDPPLRCTFAAVYKKNHYLSKAASAFISELQSFAVSCTSP